MQTSGRAVFWFRIAMHSDVHFAIWPSFFSFAWIDERGQTGFLLFKLFFSAVRACRYSHSN